MSDHFDNQLKRKLAGDADETGRGVSNVRIELITGTGRRRRRWSRDDKGRIVEGSLKPGATVPEVARRNGLSPSNSSHGVERPMRCSMKAPTRRRLIAPEIFRPRSSAGRVGKRGCPAAVIRHQHSRRG